MTAICKLNKSESEIPIKVNGTLLVGVRKDDRRLYLPDEDGMFTCLKSNEKIKFEKLGLNIISGTCS